MKYYSQKNPEIPFERVLAFKEWANLRCLSNICLPIIIHCASCIVLMMWNVPPFCIKGGWRYQLGAQWSQKWWPWGVRLIIWHRRRWFGSPTGGSASRYGTLGQDIHNYKDSTAEETELCQYCYCMPSASKFPKSFCDNGTTTAQQAKVISPWKIIGV